MKRNNHVVLFLLGCVVAYIFYSQFVIVGLKIYPYHYLFKDKQQAAFAKAIAREDIKKMQYYVDAGIDINKRSESEVGLLYKILMRPLMSTDKIHWGKEAFSPLYFALIKKKYKSYLFLLEHGADPNYYVEGGSQSVLWECLDMHDSRYLKSALEHGGIINRDLPNMGNLLSDATWYWVPFENFLLLLRYGGDPNFPSYYPSFLKALSRHEYRRVLYLLMYGGNIYATKDIERRFFEELENSVVYENTRESKERDELIEYLDKECTIKVHLKNPLPLTSPLKR